MRSCEWSFEPPGRHGAHVPTSKEVAGAIDLREYWLVHTIIKANGSPMKRSAVILLAITLSASAQQEIGEGWTLSEEVNALTDARVVQLAKPSNDDASATLYPLGLPRFRGWFRAWDLTSS